MKLRFLPALCLALLSSILAAPGVEIIAHRGASYDAPENTLASFRRGWEQGADADELDIYLTKDGQIAVIHDASTERTTGVDQRVATATMEGLRKLDAGLWKGPAWAGERIPLLSEALATIPEGRRMFIEIKCGPEVLPELQRVVEASGKKPEQLVLIGFNEATMREARRLFPYTPIYWLASYKADKVSGEFPAIGVLIEKARAAGFDGLDLDFKFPIDAAFVAQVKAVGLKLYTWKVDDPVIAKQLRDAGVDGITTDRPQWLREQLAR